MSPQQRIWLDVIALTGMRLGRDADREDVPRSMCAGLACNCYGAVGEPAFVHPHLFRHARVRQIVRHTKSLALAQKQAGWARLHTEYLTLSDDEAQQLMRGVPE